MNEPTRALLVMRHGRAEPYAAEDHDRALTERGVRDAEAAGAWLAKRGLRPTHALVSSALRAQQTWSAVERVLGSGVDADVQESLYAAGTESVLDSLHALPPEAGTVLLVGHNPTVSHLVQLLDDGEADPEVFARLAEGYPPAAVTVLRVPGPWSELDGADARIEAHHAG